MLEEFVSNFHFLRPWVLSFLLIPILFYFYVFKNDANLSSWEKVCDKNLLKFLLIKGTSSKRKIGVLFMYLGLLSAVIAASGPSWKKIETSAINNQQPVMILLNLSTDMLNTDIKPSRLDRAKMEISQFLKQLKSSESGLIVYTDEPFLISPLSTDHEIVINLLESVNADIMPTNGDRLDRAIELAVKKIKGSGYENGNIVLFTSDAGASFNASVQETLKSVQAGVFINVVNINNQKNSKLETIAKDGKGIYMQVGQDMQNLVKDIAGKKENYRKSKNKTAEWLDFGWFLLFIPMLCCLNFFRKGMLAIIILIAFSLDASAGFLFSDNYEAMKKFERKDYKTAAQKFKQTDWKGVSLYKAGDYENAAKMFADKTDIESKYNYANALAKSGQIDEAIKKYEEVLQENPKHEDAAFNLEYLKKQQQNNSKNQKNDNKQNKDQNQKNNDQNQESEQEQNNQSQASEQEQNQEENNDNQEAKAENMMAQAQAEEEQEDKQSKDNSKDNMDNKQNKEQNQSMQEQKVPKAQAKQGDKDEKYDEEVQAKVQRFREIPDDKGGLLRAFIQQEYLKKRYGD